MSVPKHPWYYEPGSREVRDFYGLAIADVRDASTMELASGKLLAAAPDMAEALQALVDHTRDECVDRQLLENARAALRKAGAA